MEKIEKKPVFEELEIGKTPRSFHTLTFLSTHTHLITRLFYTHLSPQTHLTHPLNANIMSAIFLV